MRAAILAAVACLALLAILPASEARAPPPLPCSGYLDRSDPTDPHYYFGCDNIGCVVDKEVILRCFG